MKLEGRVAVVTGASSGMGEAIARLFAQEGANVVAVARREERLEALQASATDYPGAILAHPGDVSREDDVNSMIETAVTQFGRLDILVNNAGIMDNMMPAGEASDELWDHVLAVNLTGPFWACRKAIGAMLDQPLRATKQGPSNAGNIINVSSIGGLFGSRAGAAYTASKHGLIGLSRNIGFMYAGRGIRCNAICPGGVETEIGTGIVHPSSFGIQRAMIGMETNPRQGSAEEIAQVALFLASDDSSFINGATIVADAGWTAY